MGGVNETLFIQVDLGVSMGCSGVRYCSEGSASRCEADEPTSRKKGTKSLGNGFSRNPQYKWSEFIVMTLIFECLSRQSQTHKFLTEI